MINEKIKIAGTVILVFQNQKTGKKRVYEFKNIITNEGDKYYAQRGADETPFVVAGMRLGTGVSAVAKGDTDVETFLAGSGKAIDGAYPKTDDDDSDNTGAGVKVTTWRTSYVAGEATGVDISEVAIVDNLTTPTKALMHAIFGTAKTKAADDTLKVFVNHAQLGV